MKHRMHSTAWRQRVLVLCCAGVVSGPALAQTSSPYDWGTYVGGSIGIPNFGTVGLKGFVGQQLFQYFGWEAALTTFARDIESTPSGDVKTDFWGASGAGVGILPLNKDFSLFGKLGLMAGRKRIRGPNGDVSENDVNVLIGGGARFALTPRVAIRAEYEDFHQGNLFSVGVTYKF